MPKEVLLVQLLVDDIIQWQKTFYSRQRNDACNNAIIELVSCINYAKSLFVEVFGFSEKKILK